MLRAGKRAAIQWVRPELRPVAPIDGLEENPARLVPKHPSKLRGKAYVPVAADRYELPDPRAFGHFEPEAAARDIEDGDGKFATFRIDEDCRTPEVDPRCAFS